MSFVAHRRLAAESRAVLARGEREREGGQNQRRLDASWALPMAIERAIRIRLGTSDLDRLPADRRTALVDGGNPWFEAWLFSTLRWRRTSPEQLRVIVDTPMHLRHVGGLATTVRGARSITRGHGKVFGAQPLGLRVVSRLDAPN